MKQARASSNATGPARKSSVFPVRASTAPKWREAALLASAPLLVQGPARADSLDDTIDAVIGVVKVTGEVVKSTISAVDTGVQVLKQGYETASPYIDSAVKAASPVVQQAIKVTGEAATPAIKAALPAVSDAVQGATKSISASLSNPTVDAVVGGTNKALTVVTPAASQAAKFVLNTDPVLLGEYALVAVALYYAAPVLLGAISGSFRGYSGELNAARALDELNSGAAIMIDLRSDKEKEGSGVPDVPPSVGKRLIDIEFTTIEDKKLRSALRNPDSINAIVTSLQIASLKQVNKGTRIILLDRNGASSVAVAKELARRGYGKVFTVAGGFDGRNGWIQSKLQIKPAAVVLSVPVAKTIGISKKALPAPKAQTTRGGSQPTSGSQSTKTVRGSQSTRTVRGSQSTRSSQTVRGSQSTRSSRAS